MSIQALRERLAALNKQANHLLAEKGEQVWSKDDQAKFDAFMDEAERVQSQIEATERMIAADREREFRDAERLPAGAGKKKAVQEGLDLFLRKSERHLTAEEALKVRNTMSTTTSGEGGYTVQPMVASTLVDLLKAYGFMRRVASQITTSNGADLTYPTSDGTSEVGELVTQNTAAANLDPSFGVRAVNAYKFSSKVITIPIELLQDANIDIVGMVMKRMRDRLGRIMNQYFTTGTGTGQPFGLVPAASVGKQGTTGQTTTVIYDDLVDIVDALDAAYLDDANAQPMWMFNQSTRRVVRKLKDGQQRPLWTPNTDVGISDTGRDQLLGYPVQLNNDMASMAASAKSMAFGQLSKYLIRDAMEVTLFRFDDSAFATKGQVGFLAWARAGGNLLDINSVTLYQNSAT